MTAALLFLDGVGYSVTTPAAGAGVGVTVAQPATGPTGPPRVAVIGDSFSSADWSPGGAAAGWPAVMADRAGAELVNLAVGGTGYVRGTYSSFPYAAVQVPADVDVVVVFGGFNDQWSVELTDVRVAARTTLAILRRVVPDAHLIVAGPQWPHQHSPAGVLVSIRDAVRAAAAEYGATFVDGMAERWFQGRPELIGPDGTHPNAAGQLALADRITPHVHAALAR